MSRAISFRARLQSFQQVFMLTYSVSVKYSSLKTFFQNLLGSEGPESKPIKMLILLAMAANWASARHAAQTFGCSSKAEADEGPFSGSIQRKCCPPDNRCSTLVLLKTPKIQIIGVIGGGGQDTMTAMEPNAYIILLNWNVPLPPNLSRRSSRTKQEVKATGICSMKSILIS